MEVYASSVGENRVVLMILNGHFIFKKIKKNEKIRENRNNTRKTNGKTIYLDI